MGIHIQYVNLKKPALEFVGKKINQQCFRQELYTTKTYFPIRVSGALFFMQALHYSSSYSINYCTGFACKGKSSICSNFHKIGVYSRIQLPKLLESIVTVWVRFIIILNLYVSQKYTILYEVYYEIMCKTTYKFTKNQQYLIQVWTGQSPSSNSRQICIFLFSFNIWATCGSKHRTGQSNFIPVCDQTAYGLCHLPDSFLEMTHENQELLS